MSVLGQWNNLSPKGLVLTKINISGLFGNLRNTISLKCDTNPFASYKFRHDKLKRGAKYKLRNIKATLCNYCCYGKRRTLNACLLL